MEIKAVAEPGGLAPHHSNKPGLGLRNPGIGTGKGLTGAVSTVSCSLIKLGTQFVLFFVLYVPPLFFFLFRLNV